uniref:Uncharacterized protein n=1 Tax=Anopheles funestus TaxID=62324 RepID=A0A4Y0BGL1_ANOFN
MKYNTSHEPLAQVQPDYPRANCKELPKTTAVIHLLCSNYLLKPVSSSLRRTLRWCFVRRILIQSTKCENYVEDKLKKRANSAKSGRRKI